MVFLKRRSFLRLECTLNVLNGSQQPVGLTASCPRGGGGGGGGEPVWNLAETCWVRYFLDKGLHSKITETACVSMLALKINYNLGSAFLPSFPKILSDCCQILPNVKKYFDRSIIQCVNITLLFLNHEKNLVSIHGRATATISKFSLQIFET